MSTLNEPIWSRCSISRPAPKFHITSVQWTGKDGARVRMTVAAHQERNKKTEKRKRATDFRGCKLPFCGRLGGSTAKKSLCEGSTRSNWDPRKSQQLFRPNQNGVGDRTTTSRQLLIGVDKTPSSGMSSLKRTLFQTRPCCLQRQFWQKLCQITG